MKLTIDEALTQGGAGRFQRRLLGIFGLVWAADAMQVISIGFSAVPISETFGLTVPQALQSGTVFFLGMLIGAMLFGRIADRIGRRRVLILTVCLDAVFGLGSAFSPDFITLLVLRFLTGMTVGGTLPVDYAMMAEFLPPRNRGRWLVWLESFWALGTIVIALVAWLAHMADPAGAWRWIFAVAALPALLGVGLRFWVPESPMYLLRNGDEAGARAAVDRVLQVNGSRPLDPGVRLIAPPAFAADEGLLGPALRRRSLGIFTTCFLVALSYYGIFIWLPAELVKGGLGFVRGYGFLVLMALAQVPGYALAAHCIESLGRRRTLQIFLLLSATGCLLFVVATGPWALAASLLLMGFALLGTWGALYAYTPELFPTALRATGMGTASAVSRVAGLLAPSLLGVIIARGFGTAIGFFAVLLVLAAAATLIIPAETRAIAIA